MTPLAILLAFAPCYLERSDPDRLAHVAIQAEAMVAVAESSDDIAGLITIAEHEGRLCWSVATGAVHGGNGWGPWQIEAGSRRPGPYFGSDLPSLTHAAGEALWLWRHSYHCGHSLEARYRAYAGLQCQSMWAGANSRARMHRWVLASIARA